MVNAIRNGLYRVNGLCAMYVRSTNFNDDEVLILMNELLMGKRARELLII